MERRNRMAKKKVKTGKPNGAAGRPRTASTRGRMRASSTGKSRASKPRQAVLPGTEQVRNARLDHLCEEVGDCRERMNQDRGIEQSAIRDALTEMQRTGVQAYKHAGVEFARIPGGEK